MFRRMACITAVVLSVFVANAAWAGDLITNGGFESGLTGWTATSLGSSNCNTDWNAGTSGTATGCLNPGNPYAGTYAAYSSFDGPGPLVYRLRQTISVPSSVTGAQLSWAQALNMSYNGTARTFSVNILDASLNPLGTVYSLSVPTGGYVAGWTRQSADVSSLLAANAGKTLVVEFALTVPQTYTGPGGFGLDQVSLVVTQAVPTLSDGSLVGLAILLAIATVVVTRRRGFARR